MAQEQGVNITDVAESGTALWPVVNIDLHSFSDFARERIARLTTAHVHAIRYTQTCHAFHLFVVFFVKNKKKIKRLLLLGDEYHWKEVVAVAQMMI